MMQFEGIGNIAATFAMDDELSAGQVCQLADDGAVAACDEGDLFHGVVSSVRGDSCSVTLHGAVKVSYSGTAPDVGWAALSADGDGGVAADEDGREYLVLRADDDALILFL